MKHILLFGAGKSASSLIQYLINLCEERAWKLTICDQDIDVIREKAGPSKVVIPLSLNVENEGERLALIKNSDIVISMLPAHLHFLIAMDCKSALINLLTASYIDDRILPFKEEIKEKGLLFLYEMGLDPGIDHMSATKLIHSINKEGGKVNSFKSHCGGLVSPESDHNPWHYKISWSSRNVVLAGKDGAIYKENGKVVHVPYSGSHGVFRNSNEVQIPNLTSLAWYPNRDSLKYAELYNLNDCETFLRTTLRYPAFNRGWSKLVNMGFTAEEDFQQIKDCETYLDWFNAKLKPYSENEVNWNSYLHMYVTDPYKGEFDKQISYLGLQSKEIIPIPFTCSADILQHLLDNKLSLLPDDKDMIVMLHEIGYEKEGGKYQTSSSLIVTGNDSVQTAMAKTVGLPLGIATKLILDEQIQMKGLLIPIYQEIYEPILTELKEHNIEFTEITNRI